MMGAEVRCPPDPATLALFHRPLLAPAIVSYRLTGIDDHPYS
jgi:hypothetical protein